MSLAIDLAKLPPPRYLEPLSHEEILAAAVADFKSRLRDALGEEAPEIDFDSDPAAMLLQANAYRERIVRRAVEDAARQTLLPWATGGALDWIGTIVGHKRHPGEGDDPYRARIQAAPRGISTAGPQSAYEALARAASGLVADVSAARTAPGEIAVRVLADARAETPALDSLPPAPGEAMRALLEFGAAPDYYRPGVSGDLLGGSLQLAADIAISAIAFVYAARGPSRLEVTTQGGDLAAWQGGGPSLFMHDGEDGIELPGPRGQRNGRTLRFLLDDDSADETWLQARAGGRVLAIAAPAGAVDIANSARTARAVAAVRAALNAEDARPMGDVVTVRPAALADYAIAAAIETAPGPDAETVRSAVQAAVEAYAAATRRLGADVRLGAIYAALYGPGVTNATISSPANDIAGAGGAVPNCTQVTVTLQ